MLSDYLAERAGFEPAIPLRVCRISSAVLSTTQPPLRGRLTYRYGPENASILIDVIAPLIEVPGLSPAPGQACARAALAPTKSKTWAPQNAFTSIATLNTRAKTLRPTNPAAATLIACRGLARVGNAALARLRTQELRAGRLADQGVWSAPTQCTSLGSPESGWGRAW